MTTVLYYLSLALIAYGLSAALVFRGLPAVARAIRTRRPARPEPARAATDPVAALRAWSSDVRAPAAPAPEPAGRHRRTHTTGGAR